MTATNSSYPETTRTMTFVEVWGDPIPVPEDSAEKANSSVPELTKDEAGGRRPGTVNLPVMTSSSLFLKTLGKRFSSSIKTLSRVLRIRKC